MFTSQGSDGATSPPNSNRSSLLLHDTAFKERSLESHPAGGRGIELSQRAVRLPHMLQAVFSLGVPLLALAEAFCTRFFCGFLCLFCSFFFKIWLKSGRKNSEMHPRGNSFRHMLKQRISWAITLLDKTSIKYITQLYAHWPRLIPGFLPIFQIPGTEPGTHLPFLFLYLETPGRLRNVLSESLFLERRETIHLSLPFISSLLIGMLF